MTIESRLAEIRARVETATPGPWENDETDPGVWGLEHIIIGNYTARDDFDSPMWEDGTPEDREFIAASRTDLPALLAAVEAVRKRAGRWTSLDKPEGDDFQGGFNAGVKFAAGHILRDITTELDASTTTREDQS